MYVSAKEKTGIEELKNAVAKLTETDTMTMKLVGDLIKPDDMVVLVTLSTAPHQRAGLSCHNSRQ